MPNWRQNRAWFAVRRDREFRHCGGGKSQGDCDACSVLVEGIALRALTMLYPFDRESSFTPRIKPPLERTDPLNALFF